MNTLHAILESTPTVVFLTIALCAFVFLCGTYLLGHDHTEVSHGVDHGHDSPGFFSPRVISIFCLAFGAGGAAASILGWSVLWATYVAFAAGLLLGLTAYSLLNLLYKQQANSLVTNAKLVGCLGQVVTRIPPNGCGEVTFIAAGQSMTQLASSAHHVELSVGKRVKILTVSGSALLVEAIAEA
jgi:membrane protein implicated in regulation of membrane protease activity